MSEVYIILIQHPLPLFVALNTYTTTKSFKYVKNPGKQVAVIQKKWHAQERRHVTEFMWRGFY